MDTRLHPHSNGIDGVLDWAFLVIGVPPASFAFGWWQIAFTVVFWVLLAYLVLPRLHAS